MGFDYSHYLKYAKLMADQSATESGIDSENLRRNAVSRAYYATLHGAKHYLEHIEEKVLSELKTTHDVVWNEFRGGRTRNVVFVQGDMFKKWRIWADYDVLDRRVTIPSMDNVFKTVGEIQTTLAQMCSACGKPVEDCWFLVPDVRFAAR